MITCDEVCNRLFVHHEKKEQAKLERGRATARRYEKRINVSIVEGKNNEKRNK